MNVYFDTSAVIKLYYPEAESEILTRWIIQQSESISLSLFHLIEINNAFGLKVFRKEISEDQFHQLQECISSDRASGVIKEMKLDWSAVFYKAIDIAREHTPSVGSRSLDIIHAASALVSGHNEFITFDERQGELLKVCGLKRVIV